MSRQRKIWLALAVVSVFVIGCELGKYNLGRRAQDRPQVASDVDATAQINPGGTWAKTVALPQAKVRHIERNEALPSGPFGSNVEILKRLAENNADAAYALAVGFQGCQFFVPPKDESEAAAQAESSTVMQLGIIDQLVDQAKDIASKNGKSLGTIPEVSVQSFYQENLTGVQNRARECAGVETSDTRDWMNWLRRAAQLGNSDAELRFWQSVRQNADGRSLEDLMQDKPVAEAALQDSLSHGDVRALMAIGETLDIGLFSDPDPFSAYAYFFAASQAPYADIRTLPWIGQNIFQLLAWGSNTQQYLQRNLDRTGSSLTPAQQQAAQQLGLSLYQRCCQGGGM